MADASGGDVVDRLGGKDLNKDGRIVNLAIVGSSRFYDYGLVEEAIEEWVGVEANPDLVIVGGASGVDYLAERWCDNNNVDIADPTYLLNHLFLGGTAPPLPFRDCGTSGFETDARLGCEEPSCP